MSLVAFGIRIAAVRAIRAAVWPIFKVVDSPQVPTDLLEEGVPLIAVYTGFEKDKMDGRDLLGEDPRVNLTMQIFLPPEFTITSAGKSLTLDTRKGGAETVLDVVCRRITTGFAAQNDTWSQLLGGFVQKIYRETAGSYLVATEKVRTSAREMTLDCEVLHEPIPGALPADIWADLITAMRADTTSPDAVAPLADWIAAEISGPTILSQDERDRIDMGLSEYTAQAIGIVADIEDVNDVAPAGMVVTDDVAADPDPNAPPGDAVTAP